MVEVIVREFIFCTPRITMHMCLKFIVSDEQEFFSEASIGTQFDQVGLDQPASSVSCFQLNRIRSLKKTDSMLNSFFEARGRYNVSISLL